MNPRIDSYLRHIFTAWITAAVLALTAWMALDEKSAAAMADGFAKVADGLMIVLAILVPAAGRLLWAWISKLFRTGAGEPGDDGKSGGVGTLPLLIITGTMAGLVCGLPSCQPVSQVGGIPITWKLTADGGTASYSAKRGLELEVRVEK